MKYKNLKEIEKLLFSADDVASAMAIKPESAHVLCSRYVSGGYLTRAKRNLYILNENWDHLSEEDFFQIANRLQVPSYVSFSTALSYYGLTTQLRQGIIESVVTKRSYRKNIKKLEFIFYRFPLKYYSGFVREDGIFIASPEKALADALYLTSLGRYGLDFSALEFSKFNLSEIERNLKLFPDRTKELWNRYAAV
jgi:predicted transcriptional regulator of viral defense system|tara:strand:+ start:433 stop:1017 length:585 start_codon:yes stop_codon:yes gene_type:complete